eukprot:363378-Chlamydomonas_euryale.AAC.17
MPHRHVGDAVDQTRPTVRRRLCWRYGRPLQYPRLIATVATPPPSDNGQRAADRAAHPHKHRLLPLST